MLHPTCCPLEQHHHRSIAVGFTGCEAAAPPQASPGAGWKQATGKGALVNLRMELGHAPLNRVAMNKPQAPRGHAIPPPARGGQLS